MGRDSILDNAEKDKQNDQPNQPPESAEDSDRVRITQRLPADLAADVDAVQERYSLPSRNATINFILNQGIEHLIGDRES